ncbi:MAG: SLBB domain-containing protein [Proteobacteria bacterium]|nr:SLBB domain-containing protein [Pseudomonadota bacterium]
MTRFKQASVIFFFILIMCCGSVFAQQPSSASSPQQYQPQMNQANPYGGGQPSATGQTGQQFNYQQLPPMPAQPFQQYLQQPRSPAEEKLSGFERYISDKVIEVNEFQFDIVKRLDGITFLYSDRGLIKGTIAVPVKIIKITKKMETIGGNEELKKTEKRESSQTFKELEVTDKPILIDAGFIIGTVDAITRAFTLLGLRLPFIISTDIKQYGYDLFRQPISSFVPDAGVPVGPDYVLGPGDEVKIIIWGHIEAIWNVFVDNHGNISLPKVGALNVAGLNYQELKEMIHRALSKNFTGFEMNVSMGQLRTMTVFVVGNAERPGSYTVSSFSSVINALFAAGGPSKTGTMRDIQVKRLGKTIVHFDLYDFLLKGNKAQDIRLLPEDVVFIPPIGTLVAITGSVNNPAIYELKEDATITQLIEMAGGLDTVAYKGRVQIERIVGNNRQIVYESDLTSLKEKDVKLHPGDVLKIFQVVQEKRVVKLSGAVQREGSYGLKPGMTVKDMILLAGGLKYFAYLKEAELTRYSVTEEGPKTEKMLFSLEKAMTGDPESNLALKEEDYLFIRTIPNWQPQQMVTINGEVRFPGTYPISRGERLSSIIERAGGYSEYAYLRGAVFIRERLKEVQQRNMEEIITRLERELLSASSAQTATATSSEGVTASKAEAEQKQKFLESLKKLKATGRLTIYLAHLRLLKGSGFDIELEGGDSLYIPVSNNFVNVAGSVMTQGSFIYSNTLSSKDYIELAGGASRWADTGNMYIMKVDGSAMKVATGLFSWNSARSRWETASFGEPIKEVEPGDTIVVPEKVERIAWMREIKDIAQIVANIAVSAGVVKALYQ